MEREGNGREFEKIEQRRNHVHIPVLTKQEGKIKRRAAGSYRLRK